MATTLHLLTTTAGWGADDSWSDGAAFTDLLGGSTPWRNYPTSGSAGSTNTTSSAATVDGPTDGIIHGEGSHIVVWMSPPLSSGVTISGTITGYLYGYESNKKANAAINFAVYRVSPSGTYTQVAKSANTTELDTSPALNTVTATPTSTAFTKGDRIGIVTFLDDAGTMAAFYTGYVAYGDSTWDTRLVFTETISFATAAPSGSTLYLTNSDGGVTVTDTIDKQMWTTAGGASQTRAINTATGWTDPLEWHEGGTDYLRWYSKPLTAFTLAGPVYANIRALESSVGANVLIRAELAVVDNDGTNPVVFSWGGNNAELGTGVGPNEFWFTGADLSVANGKRLRLRIFADDGAGGAGSAVMTTGYSATLYYGNGTSDSKLILSQTVTEYSAGTTYYQSVSGSITPAGALTKKGKKALSGSITPAGAITRATSKLLTAALSFTAALTKASTHSFTASLTPSGALTMTKLFTQALTAALSFTGTLARAPRKVLTASLSPSGALSRFTSHLLPAASLTPAGSLTKRSTRTLAGSISPGGALTKRGLKVLTGSITPAGDLTTTSSFHAALTATLDFTASLAQATAYHKALTAALSFSGQLSRMAGKALTAALSFTGNLGTSYIPGGTQYQEAFTAALSFTAALTRSTGHRMTASLTPAAELVRKPGKVLTAALTPAGALTRRTTHSFAASISPSGALARLPRKALAATLDFTASFAKLPRKALAGALTFAAELVPLDLGGQTFQQALTATLGFTSSLATATTYRRSLTAALSFSGAITRQTAKQVSGALTFTALLNRKTAKQLEGASLTPAGSVNQMTGRPLAGALSFSGGLATQKIVGTSPVLTARIIHPGS